MSAKELVVASKEAVIARLLATKDVASEAIPDNIVIDQQEDDFIQPSFTTTDEKIAQVIDNNNEIK